MNLKQSITVTWAVCALFALTGCGPGGASPESDADAGPDFGATPLGTVQGDLSGTRFTVRSDPSPPSRGVNAFRYEVTDASGAPLSGLTLEVQPWMPAMGHGGSKLPTVTEIGGGVYDVANVYLTMPGTWELRTSISGTIEDHATVSFEVP